MIDHPAGQVAAIDAQLRALAPDEVLMLVVPAEAQGDRALALDHFSQTVAGLRRIGWQLRTEVRRVPDSGEVFSIEPLLAPPSPKEETSCSS